MDSEEKHVKFPKKETGPFDKRGKVGYHLVMKPLKGKQPVDRSQQVQKSKTTPETQEGTFGGRTVTQIIDDVISELIKSIVLNMPKLFSEENIAKAVLTECFSDAFKGLKGDQEFKNDLKQAFQSSLTDRDVDDVKNILTEFLAPATGKTAEKQDEVLKSKLGDKLYGTLIASTQFLSEESLKKMYIHAEANKEYPLMRACRKALQNKLTEKNKPLWKDFEKGVLDLSGETLYSVGAKHQNKIPEGVNNFIDKGDTFAKGGDIELAFRCYEMTYAQIAAASLPTMVEQNESLHNSKDAREKMFGALKTLIKKKNPGLSESEVNGRFKELKEAYLEIEEGGRTWFGSRKLSKALERNHIIPTNSLT